MSKKGKHRLCLHLDPTLPASAKNLFLSDSFTVIQPLFRLEYLPQPAHRNGINNTKYIIGS